MQGMLTSDDRSPRALVAKGWNAEAPAVSLVRSACRATCQPVVRSKLQPAPPGRRRPTLVFNSQCVLRRRHLTPQPSFPDDILSPAARVGTVHVPRPRVAPRCSGRQSGSARTDGRAGCTAAIVGRGGRPHIRRLDPSGVAKWAASLVPAQRRNRVPRPHEQCAQVHLCWRGEEQIGWRDSNAGLAVRQPYAAARDFGLYDGTPDELVALRGRRFAVFFPGEIHAPWIGEGEMTKVCVKVRLNSLP